MIITLLIVAAVVTAFVALIAASEKKISPVPERLPPEFDEVPELVPPDFVPPVATIEKRRLEAYRNAGIDPDPAKRNPDGSDYHIANAIDDELAGDPRMKLTLKDMRKFQR